MRVFVRSEKKTRKRTDRRCYVSQKSHLIAMIPGDGIGHEVISSAQKVLETTGLPFEFEALEAGFDVFQKTGSALPKSTLEKLKSGKYSGAMFGAVSSPSHKVEGYSSPIVALRKELDLYANLRPVVCDAESSPFKNAIDMMIVRENTECLYVKQEKLSVLPDGTKSAVATRVITEKASRRIGQMAFNLAVQRSKKSPRKPKVTIVHKSNVLSVTDGLFRETVREVSLSYKDVTVEEQIVDSMVYRLFRDPHNFDVIVAPNLYGDILSDGAAALVGSLGLVPGANVGDNFYLAEPVHGSAPDIAGKGIANPIAAIRSAAMLLDKLGFTGQASLIEEAIQTTLSNGIRTPDIGGKSTTSQLTESIISVYNYHAVRSFL